MYHYVPRFISLLSILLVLLSTVGMCLNTMAVFSHYDVNKQPIDNPYLAIIELVCISWSVIMLASYKQSIQLIYVASRGQPEKTASRNVVLILGLLWNIC